MSGSDFYQRRQSASTFRNAEMTSWFKPTSGRNVPQRRYGALDRFKGAPTFSLECGDCFQQPARVWMRRGAENLCAGCKFDQVPRVHYCDPVGNL